jgi:hypothetical protein
MSAAREPEGPEVIEEEVERRAGGIYGTIVAAGVLVAAGDPSGGASVDAVAAGIYAVVTTVVFWLAHGFSLALARRAAGHPAARPRVTLSREWPMVAASVPLLAIIAVASLLGASDETAISAAVWGSIVVLGLVGVTIARREEVSRTQAVGAVLGCAALGGLLVLLKVVVH